LECKNWCMGDYDVAFNFLVKGSLIMLQIIIGALKVIILLNYFFNH